MRNKTLLRLTSLVIILLAFSLSLLAQTKTVTGRVTDDQGRGLLGITVTVKGTTTATQTDNNGSFTIAAPENGTLVFSSVGYAAREVAIGARSSVDVTMQTQNASLQEVVVIGYGTARRKDVTGAVSSVTAKDFNKGVQTSPEQLIQGKVAGVQVLSNSGAPGGGITVRIRGASSIRGENQPLYVVDGVPLNNTSVRPNLEYNRNNGDFGKTPGGNPLNFINPADIASIDILKDASATAIYGSRGANGVVIITTKKGQTGAPRIEFNAAAGVASPAKKVDVLSGSQYREALAKYNVGTGPDFGGDVDAMDEITQNGLTQNYNVSVSQGNDNARFRFSGGYLSQEGIIRKSEFEKVSAALTGGFRFLENRRLGLDVNLITSQTLEEIVPVTSNAGFIGSLVGMAMQWNPTRNLRNPDGSLVVDKGGDQVNPLAFSEAYHDNARVTTILATVSPSFKITPELEYRFLYSINYATGNRKSYIERYINLPNIQIDTANDRLGGTSTLAHNESRTHTLTHTLSYVKDISNNFNLNAVVGYEYFKNDNNNESVTGRNFVDITPYYNFINQTLPSDRDLNVFVAPTTELQSFFGRATVNLMDRFLLTATLRADGSSKFGENNRYGYFPSFAGAWNIGNEDFLKTDFLSNLKLRAGWGVTGNQEFPPGVSQIQYSLVNNAGVINAVRETDFSPDLKWEESQTANIGVDYGFLDNRIFGSIDVFRKKTIDLLFPTTALNPAPGGANVVKWVNLEGDVVNRGVEVAVNANVIRKQDFNWDFGVNASFLDNEMQGLKAPIETGVISGQGLSEVRSQLIADGQPLNVFYLRRFTGIDKATGISMYEGGEQRFFVGSPNPDVLLGINTRATWRKLALELSFNGAFGHYIYNNTANAILTLTNLGKRNVGLDVYNDAVSSGESPVNPVAASTRYLEKGNYLKLNNAMLSYRLGDIARYIRNANVFLTGQNLFVITDYTGFDPEVNTDKTYDATGIPSFGIEYTPYPASRIITLGVNFSL
jgi:TonB-dependent starch-binding outer membrane protein SusC